MPWRGINFADKNCLKQLTDEAYSCSLSGQNWETEALSFPGSHKGRRQRLPTGARNLCASEIFSFLEQKNMCSQETTLSLPPLSLILQKSELLG